MKIINKIFKLGIAIFCMSVTLLSCDSKYPIYTPTNDDVSWSDESKNLLLSLGDNINITLQRGVATSPLSLELNLIDTNNLVTLKNSTIDFAVDEYSKEIELDVNYANFLPAKDYSFSIAFNNQYKGPAGYDTINVVAKLKPEYEEYLKIIPTHYFGRFDPNDSKKNVRVEGYIIPSLANDTCTIYKAKGTDNYYKMEFYKDVELEFWLEGGRFKTDKFTGYNDKLKFAFDTNGEIDFNIVTTAPNEGTYTFNLLSKNNAFGFFIPNWSIETATAYNYINRNNIQADDVFVAYAWVGLNGSWLGGGITMWIHYKVLPLE